MREIKRYDLDFDRTLPYFVDHLDEGSVLSEMIVKEIDLKKGVFFTLLPPADVNVENLYSFSGGLVIPEGPKVTVEIGGKKYQGIRVMGTSKEVGVYILDLIKNKNRFLIIDDVLHDIGDKNIIYLDRYIYYFSNQVLYIVQNKNISAEIITEILNKSGASLWHLMGMIIERKPDFKSREIVKEEILNLCGDIKMIFVRAYDGEGYVFWEKVSE